MANKDLFDGKWHATIPFMEKGKNDEIGMIDMAGLDPKDIRWVMIGHRFVKAWVIAVDTEEQYRLIMRPIWAEMRREERHRGHISLNQLMEEPNFDISGDDFDDPALQYEEKAFRKEMNGFLGTLDDEEQVLADAILSKRRDRQVMDELGVSKQSTYSSRKMKVKKRLQKHFKDNW